MQSSTSIVPAQPATLTRVDPGTYGETLQPYVPPAPMPQPQPQPPQAYYYPPQAPPPPPAPAESVISVADIFAYLRRFGRLACLLALPLAGLTFFYLGFGKKVFEAESKLLIHIQATNPIQFAGNTNNNGGMSELSAPMIINNHRTGLKTRRYTDYLFTKLPRAQLESFLEDQG
ncbi:MAG: hypothetical protein JWO94_1906, partial [Verrucomicrobiaceae bacterium]|nr:hypothetical protein [Verrucomicrobiaceae bacterium]